MEQEQHVDTRRIIIATSLFSAALVLGVMVPLGYFSFQTLMGKLETGQSEVQTVIIDLKTIALQEIQAATKQANDGLVKSDIQPDPAIVASLEQLKTDIDELRNDQQHLFDEIKRPLDTVASVISPIPPGPTDDSLNQTVFFPMGKTTGPFIDEQIAPVISKIAEYGLNMKCLSNVMGFSDTLGGDKSNLKLSEERAMHVAELLSNKQVPVGDVKGWGERRLKVHTVDGIQNEQNRRVVVETVCQSNASESADAEL